MTDKKPPEDEFTDEHFEEEFNFEEPEFGKETTSFPLSTKPAVSKKYLITGIFIAVLGFLGYFGYRVFSTKPNKPVIAQSTTTQAAPVKIDQSEAAKVGQVSGKPEPTAITEQDVQGLLKPTTPTQTTTPSITAQPATTTMQLSTTQSAAVAPTKQPEKPQESIQAEKPKEMTASTQVVPTIPTPAATSTEPSIKTPNEIASGTSNETPNKTTETKTTGLTETTATTPKLETATLDQKVAQASAVSPLIPVLNPTATADMQDFHQQTQKTLEAFTKLNQQMENNLNQIKYLDSYTREVSLTVEKLNAQVTAMDNRIQALTHLANSLSKDLSKVRNEVGYVKRVVGDEGLDIPPVPTAGRQRSIDYAYPTAIEDGLDCNGGVASARKKGGPTARNEELEYIVHAVIPGRAWLKSAKGQIITVTEGENIGNYGKILVIDATNGMVLTSSGVAFR